VLDNLYKESVPCHPFVTPTSVIKR
jgi:hypothetical protein